MTLKNQTKIINSLTGFFVVSAITFVAFNNCSRQTEITPMAFSGLEKAQADFAASAAFHFDPGICREVSQYSCLQKSFSPDLENLRSEIEFPCVQVDADVQICPSGEVYNFDSSAGVAGCDNCSAEDIKSRYDLDEFVCFHVGASQNGIYPIRADGNNYEETLRQTYRVCGELLGSE